MHILGKVLIGFVVLGAGASVWLSSQALEIRNSWMKKVDELKEQNEQTAEEIAQKEKRLKELRAEMTRVLFQWDRYWNGVTVNVASRQEGTISVNIGSNHGLTAGGGENQSGRVVYAFQPNPNGGSTYVGPFQVTEARENQALLKPAWRLRAGEMQRWAPGPQWRLRALIPASFKSRFNDLEVELALLDQKLQSKQYNLNVQKELTASAQKDLELRLQELLGKEGNPPTNENLPQWMVDGLVTAIAEEEERRNEALAEVDQLRRELEQADEQLNELQSKNSRLVESLPQPETSSPTATATLTTNE